MSAIYRFFFLADTRNWGNFFLPSDDEEVSIKSAELDFASMKERVTKGELRGRVTVRSDKRCEVDDCFVLCAPELISFLLVAEAIQKSMRNTALGSALLGAAVYLSRFAMLRAQLPYVRIVLLVGSLAGAALAVLRYFQATRYITTKQKELEQVGVDFAKERTAYYSKSIQEMATALPSEEKILHPLEGAAFFRQYFSEWAKPLLAQDPQTPEEKIKWVEAVLSERTSPLVGSQGYVDRFLTDKCIEPSELKESLKAVFRESSKVSILFQIDIMKSLLHRQALSDLRNTVRKTFTPVFPAINKAFVRFTTEMNRDKQIIVRYSLLALDAALSNNTPFGKWFDKLSLDLQLLESPHPRAIYYDPVRLFLQAVATYVEKGEGEIPKADDLLFKFPPMPDADNLDLDTAFYERAKKLIPESGMHEEYLKFLEEIKTPGSF